ncbi:MAG TPA: hypothetical protein PLV35_01475, partial [Candidatus Paceibacterota bacterium]|nr:hypothetical protein [Candidatus Paceibacterota bacterium]
TILGLIKDRQDQNPNSMLDNYIASQQKNDSFSGEVAKDESEEAPLDDRSLDEIEKAEEDVDLYNINNFSI